MNEHKQSKFIIDVSASAKRPNRSTTRFFSYDSHTAEIVIQAEKDGKLIDQTLVDTVEIYFESVNMKYRPIDGLKWNDTMDISADGLYSYILPDDFLNYEGLVAFDVYINYKNGDKADSSNRIIFEQRISAIDRTAGAVELVYIKDMEDAKQAVADKADEVMADMSGYESSLADYEHQIKDGMDQLYDSVANVSADEITKIRAELPKVETAATEEITKIQAELPKVQSVATDEIGKIRDVLSTVEQTAQEVSDKADTAITVITDASNSVTTAKQSALTSIAQATSDVTDASTQFTADLADTQSTIDAQVTQAQDSLQEVSDTLTAVNDKVTTVNDTADNFMADVAEKSQLVDDKYQQFDDNVTQANQEITDILALTDDVQQIGVELNKKANKAQEAWKTPTLLNGTTGNLRYRKTEAGSVQFQGELGNLPPALTPFMTLPTTYFPSQFKYPIARGSNGINVIRVNYTNGNVMLNTATTSSYLNFDITEVFV